MANHRDPTVMFGWFREQPILEEPSLRRALWSSSDNPFSTKIYSLDPANLKLKDYYPVSIYKTAETKVGKAKFPVIDLHTHDYPNSDEEVDQWVQTMNETGVQKGIILTYSTGKRFDSIVKKYARYKDRFEVWCGFDYTGYQQAGWQEHAIQE